MRRAPLTRCVLFALALLTLLAITGAAYQTLASRVDARRFPHPGRLVSVGGFRLNVYCIGQGSPTAVLESGLADSLESWRRVQPGIARFARVCSYDPAGYGYSDPGPMPRTSDRIASELHTALRSAGEKLPYVLVRHSFGGYNIRVFNGKYPDEVAGLVLVDATQEDQYRLLPRAWIDGGAAMRRRAERQAFWASLYIGLGLARSHDKPLVVLTAGRTLDASLKAMLSEQDQNAYENTWVNDLQLRLAHLSTRGRRIMIPDSGHDMPTDRPDAIVTAVRELCGHPN